MNARTIKGFPWGGALVGLAMMLVMGACAQHRSIYSQVDSLAASGNYLAAAKLVEENQEEYGERNAVLYNMDRGVLYHYAGKYKESNQAFELAERRIDELFTESISGHAAAFLVNDNTLPYKGEDFEAVIINLYRALNYIQLGQVEGALVEARKVNHKLDLINRQYDADKKNVYAEDAFARALMGVFYEIGGSREDLNDAYISNNLSHRTFKNAYAKNYGVKAPDFLGSNLVATASFMGEKEFNEAKRAYSALTPLTLEEKRQNGQIYLVHFAGKAPTKVESNIRAVMPDGNLLKIAFPGYRPRPYLIKGSRVVVNGKPAGPLEYIEPIGAIAMENLSNRKGRIAAKAIARATTKYLANRALQERARKNSEGAGLLAWAVGNIATEATEQADLRAWETLPDRVLMGRVVLPPGEHKVVVEFTTGGGGVVSKRNLGQVSIRAGQTKFMILQTSN